MRWKLFQLKCVIFCVAIIVSDASDATRRHRREGDAKEVVKKKKKEDICVYGYCLDHSYNSMELPSKVHATHVRMNLEVSSVWSHVVSRIGVAQIRNNYWNRKIIFDGFLELTIFFVRGDNYL